jgi:hypothetical protein
VLTTLTVAGILFATVVLLQWRAGAFTAELSGYPDEASHYMSGVLVRDYIASGLPVNPMSFASNFYLHYPYLAIGHWPPLFYIIEGAWMLLFSSSRLSVMLLMAVITTVLAVSIFEIVRREFGITTAAIAAVIMICQPLVQQYTAMVMLETLLALLALWAAVCSGRYFDTGKWQDSVWFGALATLAILTKANGFELALIPPIVLLATRRFYVLRRLSFWLPVVVVGLIGLPWHVETMYLMLPTFTAESGWKFTSQALVFYSAAEWQALGIALTVLALLGLFAKVILPFRTGGVEGRWAAITSLPLAVVIFHSILSAGLEVRYLVTAVAPILLLACAGARFVTVRLAKHGVSRLGKGNLIFAAAALVFFATSFAITPKQSYGFGPIAGRITSDPAFHNSLVLVSSETNFGEGIFVSELAMRNHALDQVVVRASKVLAVNTWNQALDPNYRPFYSSAQDVAQCLSEVPVRAVILDTSAGVKTYAHHQQLVEMIAGRPDRWRMLSGAGAVRLYTPRGDTPALPPNAPLAYLRSNIGNSLRQWPVSVRLACSSEKATVETHPIHDHSPTRVRGGRGD